MTTFKLRDLDPKTPKDRQGKLEASLKAISGVETVKLNVENSEIALDFGKTLEPKRQVIAGAVSKAGFSLIEQPTS